MSSGANKHSSLNQKRQEQMYQKSLLFSILLPVAFPDLWGMNVKHENCYVNLSRNIFYFLHLNPETSSVTGSIRTKPATCVFLNCPNVWCSLTAQPTHPLGSSGSAISRGMQLSLQDTAGMRAQSPMVQWHLKRCSSKRGFPATRNTDWFLKEV